MEHCKDESLCIGNNIFRDCGRRQRKCRPMQQERRRGDDNIIIVGFSVGGTCGDTKDMALKIYLHYGRNTVESQVVHDVR